MFILSDPPNPGGTSSTASPGSIRSTESKIKNHLLWLYYFTDKETDMKTGQVNHLKLYILLLLGQNPTLQVQVYSTFLASSRYLVMFPGFEYNQIMHLSK